MVSIWRFQEASSHFNKLVEAAMTDGAQTIIRDGEPVVMVISVDEFCQLRQPKPTLYEHLRSCPEDLAAVVNPCHPSTLRSSQF
jgi:prevent-host-death family protein